MANYSLVVDSKFEPFSFERYIKPYQLYDQAYRELETQYSDYANKTGVWENLINQETEAEAYNQYKNYMTALEDSAEALMREGLNPSQRTRLVGMKGRYSKEITPIEQAYARRAEQMKIQQEMLAKDPTTLFEGEASKTSLDDYLNNLQLTYRTHSGSVLEKQASDAFSQLARNIERDSRTWRSILGNSKYEALMRSGYKASDIQQAIQGNPYAMKEYQTILNGILDSSGIKEWANKKEVLPKAIEAINRGAWKAIGVPEYQLTDNPYFNPSGGDTTNIKGVAVNPLSIFSAQDTEEALKRKQNIDNFSKYFEEKDGKYVLTEEGKKQYNNKRILTSAYTGVKSMAISPLRELMDELGATPENIGEMWDLYSEQGPIADARRYTEYNYSIKPSDNEGFKTKILSAYAGQDLPKMKFDAKSKTYVPTSSTISTDDFRSKDYTIESISVSPYGNTIKIIDGDGKKHVVGLPIGINETAERNIAGINEDIREVLNRIQTNKIANADGTQRDLTTAEVIQATQDYQNLLTELYLYVSQLPLTNTTEPQKFYPYSY